MPRKTGKILSNKTFLLVVEGKNEYLYFTDMKSLEKIQGLTIKTIKAKNSSPDNVLHTAIRLKKTEKQYDYIWCVYDYDVILKDDILEKVEKVKTQAIKKGICIADSLPSFEIWFLLHYRLPNKYYNDQYELIEELKKLKDKNGKDCLSNYEKGMSGIYFKLKDLTSEAIKNSRILANRNKDGQDKRASFCNVYKIFEELKTIKDRINI